MRAPRKSQYPAKIKVKDIEYTVVFVDQIEGRDNLGLCYGDERKLILLKNNLDPHTRFKIFIHEVLHAIENEYGFELNHDHVYKLQDGLGDLLIQNLVGEVFSRK